VFSQEERIVFHSLVIERFRGFNLAQEIPMDASAVVISGPNGRGKTSLFDAIQWLTLGRIQRLEELRFRKTEEHIINAYAPSGSKARVEAKLIDTSSGKEITAIRTGDHRSTFLEVILDGERLVGEAAEELLKRELGVSTADEDIFERDFLSAALLQQDSVRSFLSTASPADRYEILSRLLGLSIVNDFVDQLTISEKHLGDSVKKATAELQEARSTMDKAEQDVKESRIRIETAPVLAKTVKDLKEKSTALDLNFIIESHPDSAEARYELILRDVRQYRQLMRHLDEMIGIIRSHFGKMPAATVDKLHKSTSNVTKQLEQEKTLLETDHTIEQKTQETLERIRDQTDNLRQVAVAAIPLLTDHCPVCSQKIDTDHVRAHLESLMMEQPELLQAKESYEKAKKTVATRQKRISQLQIICDKAYEEIRAAESWQAHTMTLMDELREIGKSLKPFGFPPIPEITGMEKWLPPLNKWALDCSKRLKELEELAEKTVAAESIGEETRRLKRLKTNLVYLQQQCTKREKMVEQANHTLTARRRLIEGATDTATKVVGEAFAELEPVVQDLFCRLAPHPTFNQLSFSHEVYYKRGSSIPLAIDQQAKRQISPAIGFSSAQANVAALCYFLALAFASSEADFGFVLLDDPLQSMDDVNVLGFSDLCRFLRKEKQLVISTHEDRLCHLLRRKLISRDAPLQTLILNFSSWNRSGPYIEVERVAMKPEVPILSALA
jgi:hypothetical protein